MDTEDAGTQVPGDSGPALTIGDLSRRTGLSPATLRMWESRHGFPEPARLESGHRRYSDADVEAIRSVVRRRDAGSRLEQAIAHTRQAAEPVAPSVYAQLRKLHPGLGVHRLRKRTLIALSWAIEDEFCAKADRARIWGCFQDERHYRPSQARWTELARVSGGATVLAAFDSPDAEASPRQVDLPADAPMRREWALVCDAVDLPVVLSAWELPAQDGTPDRERLFESVWTVEPSAVQDAARVCASVAGADVDAYDARPVVPDRAAVTALFNRMVAYVDRLGA